MTENAFRIVGKFGDIPFDEPAENPSFGQIKFVEYVADDAGNLYGARFMLDLGHGYGFNNGKQEATLNLDEAIDFDHEFTDTSDGMWHNSSIHVSFRLVKNTL